MTFRPSVLCPIDFSDNARGALRYAAAIAAHFHAPLTLLAVNDPLLEEAAALSAGPDNLAEDTRRELERFFSHTFERPPQTSADVRLEVVTGKPAPEILRVSRERSCDLLVMGSHGSTGFRKLFFGSTTERVLRETSVPVLVTPGNDPGPLQKPDIRHAVRRLLAPVDLSSATAHQLATTARIAEALQVPWLVLHVIEPVRSMVPSTPGLPNMEAERRDRAERQLESMIASLTPAKPETLIAYGEPAEEVAKVAADRNAGLIVMGLHSSPVLGPRMGSVTYRVLCLAHRLVLALPPEPT
jgi:nucleotide-binding universal stress UspA family protein